MNQRDYLIRAAITYQGDWSKISEALSKQIPLEEIPIEEPCLTIFDEQYPMELRQLRFPPWVIFYEGNLSLLNNRKITIVGSRLMSNYAKNVTMHIAGVLAEKYTLVSGLAKGVDAMVHQTAVQSNGYTIGVIGSGLDIHYPRCNEELYEFMKHHHLILSEYPKGTGVRKEHFPWRNRILAALAEKVIVTQASVRSGTMLTVNEAIALSKEIYCIPYPYHNQEGEGCNLLISQGAQVLYQPEQLLDFLKEKKVS